MLDCNGPDCHSCQGCTHLIDYLCEELEEYRAENARPWNIHEIEGSVILTEYEYLRLVFNPKLDSIVDLWFLHNSVSMEKWMLA